jgi:hypothetical protein
MNPKLDFSSPWRVILGIPVHEDGTNLQKRTSTGYTPICYESVNTRLSPQAELTLRGEG